MRHPRVPPLLVAAALAGAGLAFALLAETALAQSKPPPLGAGGGGTLPGKPPPLPPTGARPPAGPGPQAAAPPPAEPGPGKPPPSAAAPPSGIPPGRRVVSSGTGFVIGANRLLTNHHVANGCVEMRARTSAGQDLVARMLVSDEQRDLALLEVQGDPGPILRFRNAPPIRRGESVVTYGFPLAGLLSSGPTLTTGDISALAGLRDNARQYQMSAPVQPGNSGGPLLDLSGNVVGIVVSKLNAQRIAEATGDIPQNVNFAVKGAEAIAFLTQNGVPPQLAESQGPPHNAAEVGEIAHPSTLFLRCLQ